MLFTPLTFPLRCTLDIDRSGRGRLFTGPFANEAIKSVLAWLSEGPKRRARLICSLGVPNLSCRRLDFRTRERASIRKLMCLRDAPF